jgi:glutamate synthase (NADPH/NADH) large chain
LSPILATPAIAADASRRRTTFQDHELEKHFDHKLISAAASALEDAKPVKIELPITNVDQAVGTMLGNELTKRYAADGLPDGTIDIFLNGSAGQSFGAFIPKGIKLNLEGDSNDYVGKGLSGGIITIKPNRASVFAAEKNIIAGNVIGYGATSGAMYLRGIVGERFLVRNSGATAVAEGCGDHALEYMTGGVAVILGSTGRNLGAGMSGGYAYVLDLVESRVNQAAIRSGEIELTPLNDESAEHVRALIGEHVAETGSAHADALLADWDRTRERITAITPRDFRMVTQIRSEAVDAGIDPDGDDVWLKIMEVTGG